MTSHHATPDDGRPSVEARTRLAEDLHEQLASSRMAWDAALLRSDAALASGDEAEVQAALADHRLLLGVLEERLGAVVAAATVTREAEQVVHGRAATVGADLAPADVHATPPVASGSDPRRDPVTPSPGHRLVSALAGVAAALVLVTGLLGADLRLGPDGVVAGTATQDEPDVRARVAATTVVRPALPGLGGVAGPRAALPRFSGSLPPATAPTDQTETPGPASGVADAAPGPAGGGPAGPEGAPTVPAPSLDVPTTVDAPEAPSLPRPEELIERLADRDGGDGEDVGASLPPSIPRSLAEILPGDGGDAGVLPEVLIEPSASDPTGGLG